jgi:iron complex transport system ATP-binding protein
VLCILHDLSLAARFADDLIVLQAGRIAAAGSPLAVLTPRLLAEIFGILAEVTPMDGRPTVTPLRPLEIDD